MRLITTKQYRAFPELDHLDDAQCEALLARVRRGAIPPLVMIPAFIVTYIASLFILFLFANALSDSILGERLQHPSFMILNTCLIFLVPCTISLISRDLILKQFLKDALSKYINQVHCLKCEYVLLGLSNKGDIVICPECGHHNQLSDLGLTAEDLILPKDQMK